MSTISRNDFLLSLSSKDKNRFDEYKQQLHPIDVALYLERSTNEELDTFIKFTDVNYRARILEQASIDMQIRFLEVLQYEEIVDLFALMSNDDVADTLSNLPIHKRKALLNEMKASETQTIETLLGYSEDSAGGIMTTEFIALKKNLNVKDALLKIKEIGPKTEVIELIFVIDDEQKLYGTVDLRDIFVAEDKVLLEELTNVHVVTVYPETDQEKVSLLVSKYDLKAIPVINKQRALLGIITVDDIIDVIVQEHTEDMLRLAGVRGQDLENRSVFKSVQRRLPWLMINLGTAFLAAFTVTLFESVIAQVVALASSMSIVTGMGGNAGNQSLSVVVRGIALGELDFKKSWPLVFREMLVGITQGAIIGILAGIILYMKVGNTMFGVIIFIAMVMNMLIATSFGFLIPLIIKRFNFDPALGSSIFLTASTDIFGFFIFLSLAKLFLPYLT